MAPAWHDSFRTKLVFSTEVKCNVICFRYLYVLRTFVARRRSDHSVQEKGGKTHNICQHSSSLIHIEANEKSSHPGFVPIECMQCVLYPVGHARGYGVQFADKRIAQFLLIIAINLGILSFQWLVKHGSNSCA
jgi:hypothetical protein